MPHFGGKYINPFTDYGFKRLFGEEPNKDLLIDFLNELLREEQGEIVDLQYLKNEHLGYTVFDRKVIYDLYCTNEKGEKFIVELQKAKQQFFKDRTVYYSTFPIQEQAKIGRGWDFELKKVYTIAILDFIFDEDSNEPDKYRYDVKLTDIDTNHIFYDKLMFIYLEMPKFNKTIDELETRFDKWLYLIRNLHKLDRIPDKLREKLFEKLFKTAEIARMTKKQLSFYQESIKHYRDIKNSFDTAREEGLAEGRKEGIKEGIKEGKKEGKKEEKVEIAKNLLKSNIDIRIIAKSTGLSENEINNIKDSI